MIYSYDPQTKMQSSQWKTQYVTPIRKKATWKDLTEINVNLLFLYRRGCLVGIFTPRCDCEFKILRKCADKIARSHPEKKTLKKGRMDDSFDNASHHTSFRTLNFLAKHKITCMNHPPYSSDMAPCNFYVFTKLKANLKGERFKSIEEIQATTIFCLISILNLKLVVYDSSIPGESLNSR